MSPGPCARGARQIFAAEVTVTGPNLVRLTVIAAAQ